MMRRTTYGDVTYLNLEKINPEQEKIIKKKIPWLKSNLEIRRAIVKTRTINEGAIDFHKNITDLSWSQEQLKELNNKTGALVGMLIMEEYLRNQ